NTTYLSTLQAWQDASGQDAHSMSAPPLFVDAAGGDYHVQSTEGSYHGGAWTLDGQDSPCIDGGFGDVGDEPAPNAIALWPADLGQRNLGAYGGTEQASRTPHNRQVTLLEPVGGEQYLDRHVPIDVRWEWRGADWAPGDTLSFEYSSDSCATWSPVQGGDAIPVEAGAFVWDVSRFPTGHHYRLRMTCTQDPAATDASADDFHIGTFLRYFVNDSATANDIWCTAPGDDANDGLSHATPKASVQAIVDTYSLVEGETVRIDTGAYAGGITVGASDGGSSAAPVTFEVSPFGVIFSGLAPAAVWHLDQCTGIVLTTAASGVYPTTPRRWMRLTGGGHGLHVDGASHITVRRVEITGNTGIGIPVEGAANLDVTGALVHGNGGGIRVADSHVARVENCTVFGNASHAFSLDNASTEVTVQNSILWADGAGASAVDWPAASPTSTSDYNDLYATNTAVVSNRGATLAAWQAATGLDAHSLSQDPLFVDAAGGDCHVQSEAKSYHDGAWSADGGSSACIDAGLGDAGDEPPPNTTPGQGAGLGQRNLGAYGGSEQGSKTPGVRYIELAEPAGGEGYENQAVPVDIRWSQESTGWAPGDTVLIDYSDDSGATWTSIATGVPASDETYPWDISALPAGEHYRVRVTCEQDAQATNQSRYDFFIGVAAPYYVNDGSVAHDAWCTAPGDDANDGRTPGAPKATVQAILDTYDLEPGNRVRIDTGTYVLD
ncbi:right-handed parallel beta-helix repeat-containing protein, partial [bacterium]|nr:right-handed parallel beta-helix repeat-containing protein [bacterium]